MCRVHIPNYLFSFYFVSSPVLFSWEDPKLDLLSLTAVPCPPLTMSTNTTHTHSTDERLSPNDKVPGPLNTSKIELGAGALIPPLLAPPISTTISRSLNQTRTSSLNPQASSSSVSSLQTQTQRQENTYSTWSNTQTLTHLLKCNRTHMFVSTHTLHKYNETQTNSDKRAVPGLTDLEGKHTFFYSCIWIALKMRLITQQVVF